MPVVLLLRHGQASFGEADYDVLSDVGAEQVAAAHAALTANGTRATALVSGGLRRQRDSALPWTAPDAPLATDERWDEYDSAAVLNAHGDVAASLEAPEGGAVNITSRGFQEILDPALERWIEAGEDGGDGEPWPAFRERCLGALHDLAGGLGSGETGITFTSGGVIAACAAALIGAPDRVFVTLNRTAVNAAITKVLVGRRGLSLVSYNEHGHLAPGQVTYR